MVSALCPAQIKFDPSAKSNNNLDLVTINFKGKSLTNRTMSWREADKKVNFSIQLGSRPATKAILAIWVLGDPSENSHIPGQTVAKPSKVGKVAFVQDLGMIKDKIELTVDFGSFAPSGNPLGFVTLSTSKGSSAEQAAKAMANIVRKDTLSSIGREGTVRYAIQVTTADGSASTTATVEYGEFAANKSEPKLEYLVTPSTPEFPDDVWGATSTISSVVGGTATLRWTPPKGTTSAEVQIIKELDAKPWPEWNLTSTIYKAPVTLSGTGAQKFNLDISKLLTFADQSRFVVKVIPQSTSTLLASHPSTPVFLTLSKKQVEGAKPTLQFKTELVGWSQGYLGTPDDIYHWVVSEPKWADIKALEKITGGPVTKGTKVYLPPAAPPKELAWYQKVVGSINGVINKITYYPKMYAMNITSVVTNVFPRFPFLMAESFGLPPAMADKAYEYASKPLKLAEAPLNALDRIKRTPDYLTNRMLDEAGITDPNKRQIMKGNAIGGINGLILGNAYAPTSPETRGLSADPDFEIRTGVAYVKVTATANGKVPKGFRVQGPSISMEVGNLAQNSELLGTKPEYYPIYTGYAPSSTLADGESVIVPVVMAYHSIKTQRSKDWDFGWYYANQTRYTVNGKTFFGAMMHTNWGIGK